MNIKLTSDQRIKILDSNSLFKILEQILEKENLIDRDRKQCFVISLGTDKQILNVELISLGSRESIIIEPLEVYGQSIAKRANEIILVLFHGNRELKLLKSEMELINRIYNCGQILNTEMTDCLVVNNESYKSIREDESLYNEIIGSNEFVPAHKIRSEALAEGWNLGVKIVARNLIESGVSTDVIINSTQLDSAQIRLMQTVDQSKRK